MVLYIKNMVCHRCITAVKTILNDLKLPYQNAQLGEIELINEPSKSKIEELELQLKEIGFRMTTNCV